MGQVIDNASKVVDGAKKLWRSDSKKSNVDEFDISEGETIYTSLLDCLCTIYWVICRTKSANLGIFHFWPL